MPIPGSNDSDKPKEPNTRPVSDKLPTTYDTDSRNFAVASVIAGYPIVGSVKQSAQSHLVLFRFELASQADLSRELTGISFLDFLTAWKTGVPPLPILDIRRLEHAMEVVNFHMKEAKYLGQTLRS